MKSRFHTDAESSDRGSMVENQKTRRVIGPQGPRTGKNRESDPIRAPSVSVSFGAGSTTGAVSYRRLVQWASEGALEREASDLVDMDDVLEGRHGG